jgi:hypothetical protein
LLWHTNWRSILHEFVSLMVCFIQKTHIKLCKFNPRVHTGAGHTPSLPFQISCLLSKWCSCTCTPSAQETDGTVGESWWFNNWNTAHFSTSNFFLPNIAITKRGSSSYFHFFVHRNEHFRKSRNYNLLTRANQPLVCRTQPQKREESFLFFFSFSKRNIIN